MQHFFSVSSSEIFLRQDNKKKKMSFTQFLPDTAVWTKYFVDQVTTKNQSGGLKSKASDAASPIGGGISSHSGASRLIKVGKVKDVKVKGQPETVKVQITSPVEATVEQAESELKHIKGNTQNTSFIPKTASKRRAPAKKRRTTTPAKKEGTSKKKKSTKQHNDVFSK